jgi:outer membrane protein OmpA-like peptidoglycan-associated protein
MMRALRFAAPLACALILASCASGGEVVVLPAADGHIGGIVVHSNDGKTVVLDKAYASDVPGDGAAGTARADDVDKAFADVLAARPIPPDTYRLKFGFDYKVPTEESAREFEKVFPDIHRRQAAEIVITGHTDTAGTLEYNDGLSLQRAEAARQLFSPPERQKQLPAGITIKTVGRGKRDAHVPAGIDCDKNHDAPECERERYVEVTVQ